jgi:hypothetical protein
MNNTIESILQKATRAPSGHNTQPWKFEVKENIITIFPDYKRSLPVVDGDHHALFIALGCALENLVIAAQHFNYDSVIKLNTQQQGEESIVVTLLLSAPKSDSQLYDCIDLRQVTRNTYSRDPIPASDLQQLQIAAVQNDVASIIVTRKEDIEPVIKLVKEGTIQQFSNPYFISELSQWIRFNKTAAMQTGDGLYGATTGNPALPTWMGKIFMKFAFNPQNEAKKMINLIHSSSDLMIFIAQRNDKQAWINVGRSFERTMLMATQLNIHHSHANMPCEEVEIRNKLIQQLHLTRGEQPLLLIRLGYSEKMSYSFRRPIESVTVLKTD